MRRLNGRMFVRIMITITLLNDSLIIHPYWLIVNDCSIYVRVAILRSCSLGCKRGLCLVLKREASAFLGLCQKQCFSLALRPSGPPFFMFGPHKRGLCLVLKREASVFLGSCQKQGFSQAPRPSGPPFLMFKHNKWARTSGRRHRQIYHCV